MQNESGRSMLEMLGVMAIAGLLGIGSVEGYQAAVRKNQANNILEGAAQRAIVVSQQAALDRDLDNITLGEFPTDAGRGATFPEKPKKLNEEFFSLPITGVDEATCKQLQMMAGGSLRRVDCIPENGSVRADLIYHKELSEDAGDLSAVEIGHSGAGTAATRRYDNNKEDCEKNGYQYCSDDICITKEETCEAGSALCADEYPGTSEHNSGGYAGEVEGKTCRCPANQVFNQNNKKCISACSGHGTLNINENDSCECVEGYGGDICETEVHCSGGAGIANTTVDGVSYTGGTADVEQCRCPAGQKWAGSTCQDMTPQEICEQDETKVWCDNGCWNANYEVMDERGVTNGKLDVVKGIARMYSKNGACACPEMLELDDDVGNIIYVTMELKNHVCFSYTCASVIKTDTTLQKIPVIDRNSEDEYIESGQGIICDYPVTIVHQDGSREEVSCGGSEYLINVCGFKISSEGEVYYCPPNTYFMDRSCLTCKAVEDTLVTSGDICEKCGFDPIENEPGVVCYEKGTHFGSRSRIDGEGDPSHGFKCSDPREIDETPKDQCDFCSERVWSSENNGTCKLKS